ncbi:MAG: hypothetical protein JSW50_06890 [Candidatus Latescibacterota bacterium]|nr:MAG: hypothetical protein JSW50_06890 [Candidatus Latescibacterota bacterium]
MSRIRIGTPSHLATRPLVFGLTENPRNDIELAYGEPGSLALALDRGDLDAALIPSIEFLRGVGKHAVNGPALVARRPTGSLKLVANKPLPDVRSIAVDEFSRTTLVVLRVVLDKIYHVLPDFCVHKAFPFDSSWRDNHDGVLLDGDQGLRYCSGKIRPDETCYDIDAMWFSLFPAPLVLSLWAYNDEHLKNVLEPALIQSRDAGVRNLPRISGEMTRGSMYDKSFMHEFYHKAWGFNLGSEEEEGFLMLERFARDYELLQTSRLESALVG